MTAVIYARYSSDSQREASIEGQLRDCKDYAEKNGITVVGTYIDQMCIRDSLSSMIFSFIVRHQNPNEKCHRHSAQNSRIKFYTQKSAKIGFTEPFCRSSPNFATDLLQTCYKRLKRGPPTPVSYTHLDVYKRQFRH